MSFDLIVYLERDCMPSPRSWQAAIDAGGFAVRLDPEFDVEQFSGFLPCEYQGGPSGFEYRASRLSEAAATELAAPRGADFEVTLAAHSDHHEVQCALVVASALCMASGGLLVDPQSGEEVAAQGAFDWARERLRDGDSR